MAPDEEVGLSPVSRLTRASGLCVHAFYVSSFPPSFGERAWCSGLYLLKGQTTAWSSGLYPSGRLRP